MKKILFLLLIAGAGYGQDSTIKYTRIIQADELTKDQIFDRALVWVSQHFENSNFAVRVKERDGGIIAGKASYVSPYKYYDKVKKDSVKTKGWEAFLMYRFDWLIKVKDGKLSFTIENIMVDDYPAIDIDTPPYKILLQNKATTLKQWQMSKLYFKANLSAFSESLRSHINKDDSF
jgi:hypothetical protein